MSQLMTDKCSQAHCRRLTVLARHTLAPCATAGGSPASPPMPSQRMLPDVWKSDGSITCAQTEHGHVNYRLYGKDYLPNQPLLVIVHGFSIPGVEQFAPLAELISMKGIPVLTLDLFGRGFSDRPLVRYNGELFTSCVVGLLKALKLDQAPVDILGFSMGGRIIQHITLKHPELIRRMIFYAPDGTRSERRPDKVRLQLLNYGTKLMSSAVNKDDSSWSTYYMAQYARFKAYGLPDEEFQSVMSLLVKNAQFEFAGFAYGLGSSLVDLMDEEETVALARLKAVGNLHKPTMGLWGTADTDVPYPQHVNLLKHVPQCKLHSFEGEPHMFFTKEANKAPVANLIADFVLQK